MDQETSSGFQLVYHRIRHHVYLMIASAAPGDGQKPLTTEKELCELFHASRGTVRKALRKLCDEGLLISRPHYGTFLNPLLLQRTMRKPVLGILVGNGDYTFFDEQIQRTLCGIYRSASRHGCMIHPIQFADGAESLLAAELKSGLSGVLWIWTPPSMERIMALLEERNIPQVHMIPLQEKVRGGVVLLDGEDYGYQTARRAIAAGYPDTLYLEDSLSVFSGERLNGIRRAFREAGIPWKSSCFLKASIEEIWKRAEKRIATGKHRAVCCSGRQVSLIREFPDLKVISPVCGRDAVRKETSAFPVQPILPAEECGRIGAEMLIAHIGKPAAELRERVVLKLEFPDS